MPAFKPLTPEQVDFTFKLELDQEGPRGAFGYETEAENKAAEDAILARLERNDERAWCWIQVTATDRETGAQGHAGLGGVNLGEDAGWGDRLEATVREQFGELWTEALDALNGELLQRNTPKVVRMCATKYLGPTDHRESRVRARHVTTRKVATVPWDDALDEFENHAAAAEKVLGARPHFSASVDGGGYLMGLDPAKLKG